MTDSFAIEYLNKPAISKIKCVVLDYDGTLTTLRKGWEFILYPYVRDQVNKDHQPSANPVLEDDLQYLVAHAGGTTPRQLMARIVSLVEKYHGEAGTIEDYLQDFGRIFNDEIARRLEAFDESSEGYLIDGVLELLSFLEEKNTLNYVVTGSCEVAVSKELKTLSLDNYFLDVFGANAKTLGNHKEESITAIMTKHKLKASEILIVGDGSTEMRAAAKYGLPSLGVASDEHNGGLCSKKRQLMLEIGVDAIVADYRKFTDVWQWFHS